MTRAYLDSTVGRSGEPADDSAQLTAALLAVLDKDAPMLEALRERFAGWHRRVEADGIDATRATVVRLAADGLWLSALLGLPGLSPEAAARVLRMLRSMTGDSV